MSLESMPVSIGMEIDAHSDSGDHATSDAASASVMSANGNGNNGNGHGNGNGNSGNGHICTDPDEHGPQGNGNGHGHSTGIRPEVAALQESWPSTTPPYDESAANPRGISSKAYVNLDEGMAWLPEDNNNKKHTDGEYTPPPDAEPESPYGVAISVELRPKRSNLPNDAYLTNITLDFFNVKGTFYTGDGRLFVPDLGGDEATGDPIRDNFGNVYTLEIENDFTFTLKIDSSDALIKPVDLAGIGGLYFVPDTPYSDEDIELTYAIQYKNKYDRSFTQDSSGSSFITVDAVADLPDYNGGADDAVTVGPDADGTLLPSETRFENGIVSQSISGSMDASGAHVVFNLGNFQFYDYADNSEEHFLLVKCEADGRLNIDVQALGKDGYEAFMAPGGPLDTVWLDENNQPVDAGAEGATQYYKISIDNAYLARNNGNVTLNVPILVSGGTANGDYALYVKVGAAETTTGEDWSNFEVDFGNNFAVTDVKAVQVKVQSIESRVTISTGWAYESGAEAGSPDNPHADPGVANGQNTFTPPKESGKSAAFIDLDIALGPDEQLGEYLNLGFAPNIRGTIYLEDGTPRSSGAGGGDKAIATLLRSDVKDGHLRLYFVPDADSDASSDLDISYEFQIIGTGSDGMPKTFTAQGKIPVVIDAVADPAETALAPSGEAPDVDGFVLEYEAKLSDDAAETQYIVIRNPGNLLKLGALDDADQPLPPVEASELREYENADPAIGHHFDDLDPNDIILRVSDLKALGLLDTSADGTAHLNLPLELADRSAAGEKLDIQIDAVVVQGGGNRESNWDQAADREYDFGNNIAVTTSRVTVELSSGTVTLAAPAPVYEDDRDEQHLHGAADAVEHGTAINLSFADPCEALREISFRLGTADNSPVDGVMVFGHGDSYTEIPAGGKVLFAAREIDGKAYYTSVQILDGDGNELWADTFKKPVTLDALHARNDYSGLRFIPTGDSDSDVTVEISSRVMDVRSGDVVTNAPETITIVRDAVADLPTQVTAKAAPQDGHPAFVSTAGVTVDVTAAFGDYEDGSENHYILVSRAHLASLTVPGDFELLDATAASKVCAQIDGEVRDATADAYFVIKVSAQYLQDHNGRVNLPLSGTLPEGAAADGSAEIAIKAVAVDRDGFQDMNNLDLSADNKEVDKSNNVAVVDTSATVTWATLENEFTIASDGPAYENDQPNQHLGNTAPAGGAPIKIVPQDTSEVIETLTIAYEDEDGNAAAGVVRLTVDGNRLDIPAGATLYFTYSATDPTLCTGVSYTGVDGEHSLSFTGRTLVQLTEGKSSGDGLRYVPGADGNHSDVDITITFSGTGRETQSGETADFPARTVLIRVDAVADKPAGATTEYAYGKDADGTEYTAVAEGSAVSFKINAAFADFGEYAGGDESKDESEAHYLFINTKYLANNSELTLTDTSDGNRTPFTSYEKVEGADLTELYSQTGLANDDACVVLKINPAYLQSTGGKVSLTIDGTLKDAQGLTDMNAPQKTKLTFDVKAVAVEHQGYKTATDIPLATPHGNEVSKDNNVAVTDIGVNFMWDALSGEFTPTTEPAFEGNQPGQNNGDFAPAQGAALTITPADETEIFTSLTLDYSGAHGHMELSAAGGSLTLAPNARVTFTYDVNNPTRIIRAECGSKMLDIPHKTLAELTGEGLRYVPDTGDNDDADIKVGITAETRETTIGTTGAWSGEATIVVDAVADQPRDVAASFTAPGSKNNTVIVNDTTGVVDLKLKAIFGDYADTDTSEAHYFFISAEHLSSVSDLPPELSLADDVTAARLVSDAGLSGSYIVLRVSDAFLQSHAGKVDVNVKAHLDSARLPAGDQTVTLDIKAGAIEHLGVNTKLETDLDNGRGKESDAANNVSLVDASLDLSYARLENGFAVNVVEAWEGDAPGQHTGNTSPAGGAVINFAPADTSEVFDTLHVRYNDAEGSLFLDLASLEYGNIRVELPDGADIAFTYRNDGAGATHCTVVTVTLNGSPAIYTLAAPIPLHQLMGDNRLRYIPAATSQDDADVTITFSGTSRETATNESGGFSHEVLVRVDAVADKPEKNADSEAVNQNDVHTALDPARPFTVTVDVTFGSAQHGFDLTDGSERHYLFVSRAYLASLTVPAALTEKARLLSDADAAAICRQVDGPAGIPGASSADWFVLEVDGTWLSGNSGAARLALEGMLKDASALPGEGANLALDIKAVAVEHQGFLTDTNAPLDPAHGYDTSRENNVAVETISASFTFAVADGVVHAAVTPAFEGQQQFQHEGNLDPVGGAAITLAPQDASEVFTELTLNYSQAHGALTLSGVAGSPVTLQDGAKLVFTYAADHPAECLSVEVWQPGDTSPSAILSYAAVAGRGLSLSDLTSRHLSYLPNAGDNDDADLPVTFTGTALETESGATAPVSGTLNVVVDAVADMPARAGATPGVRDDSQAGSHPDARPGETFTVTLTATFGDYDDASEAHYIFISRAGLPTGDVPEGIPAYAPLVTDPTELAALFTALYKKGEGGIHAGTKAQGNYYVLKVNPDHLREHSGESTFDLKIKTDAAGAYHVDAKAVAIEHQGYATSVNGINGGEDRDIRADNNVAVQDMSFDLVVREFKPQKVTVTLESEWAFENDRSQGDETYHVPTSEADRDHGVRLLINGQGEGNVIASITFEYPMPSNGSLTPHEIRSLLADGATNPNVTSTCDTTSRPGYVIVTVTAADPFAGVGDLHFIPGDNYDNDDVDITVTQVDVADPKLHAITSSADEAWGTGVAENTAPLHVKVDAVAQAPEADNLAISNDAGNPVQAGLPVRITGTLSYEDLADGSEEHFFLMEIQDGYYPDEVTLTFGGHAVTFTVQHYKNGVPANYTLQELVTEDDGQPHLFIKLPVDAYLHQLMGDAPAERMDGITFAATYQTREWAQEGAGLHFAAASTEDVEEVREFDPNTLEITNNELPFDKQLEQYVQGLKVMDNNTAITIAAQGAYVFWDEYDADVLNFKGYVFENDRPSDHLRKPAYAIHRDSPTAPVHIEQTYPVSPELRPFDPVANTGRDYGTGVELKIPANTYQIRLTEAEENAGEGDFYFLPETVWQAYMQRPAPLVDTLGQYRVPVDGSVVTAKSDGYTLVFIPKHEPYNAAHAENDAHGSHNDHDFRFSYELTTNEYGPSGDLHGHKRYFGQDQVIRSDAVANQAELLAAGTDGAEQFSLWNIPNTPTTTTFDLTVGFHDVDQTEDHYILVQMVPNFAFRCGSYVYRPGAAGSISATDDRRIYTHVHTDEHGKQTFIRYYKIPVDLADIDPVTGAVTVEVEFIRQPGMPAVADYPSSDLLSYGALTEDKTCSRWDSTDPTADNFINRKDADGEYSYENNTSVIIRNGIDNGADDTALNPGWWNGSTGGGDAPDGSGGYIHWENGPGSGWSGGYLPVDGKPGEYWKEDGPAAGGAWWEEQGKNGVIGGSPEELLPPGGGAWKDLPGGGIAGGTPEEEGGWANNKWIASHSQGVAIEWVFENSTPLGHTEAGKYNNIAPTEVFLTGENSNADYIKISIPNIIGGMIESTDIPNMPWYYYKDAGDHAKAFLFIWSETDGYIPVPCTKIGDKWVSTINAPGGELPPGQHLFMIVSPDSMGEDFQMGVQWYNSSDTLLSSGPVDVLVDAVAQWANFELDSKDGIYGVAGDTPTELVRADVNAYFLDQDGSEANYVLVEKIPGVLALHKGENGSYDAVREVYLEGKTYFMIAPTRAEQKANKVSLEFSINEDLTSPMYIEAIEYEGHSYDGMKIAIGTMTVEGQTGRGAGDNGDPANWEYTLSNNTSLNMQDDALTIVISNVNAKGGNSSILAQETHDPDANLIWLNPDDPARSLNLVKDHNDILTGLIFTSMAGNGSFWYMDDSSVAQPVPLGVDMAAAYLAGKICYRQDRYQDADASLGWTATLQDGLTASSTDTVSGTLTVAVDAVAKADEITVAYPNQDKVNNTLTQTLTFADHEANEEHYAVIAPDLYRVIGKQADVLDAATGTWHTMDVVTIFSPSGDPYYAVRVDDYLDSSGSVTVRFGMRELNVPGIEQYPVISGGVSIEPNSGFYPADREPVLTNNWAINTRVEFPGQGVVSTTDLAFTAIAITEDDAQGAPITLHGTLGDNDTIQSAVLTFSAPAGARAVSDLFGGPAGEQIATILYDGQCSAVTLDGAGRAVASLAFGARGFDAAADFRIIWAVAHIRDGKVVVDSWNHNAEDCVLDLTTAFTLRNAISGQTAALNGSDPDGVRLIAQADAAASVSGQTTAINDQPATAANPVGAGADDVTITLTGEFVDVDGSESHFLLLEVPSGWQVVSPMTGTFQTISGVRCIKVEVAATLTNPTAEVTLRAPDGLNRNVQLRTGALVEEANAHSAFTLGDPVTLHVSDVSAAGVSAAPLATLEDAPVSLASLADAALLRADANDVLLSVTFTNLKGGTLVDASGNELAGHTFTRDQLASGDVWYLPAANDAGPRNAQGKPQPVLLGYNALIGESDTGATAAVTGQTLRLTITPAADAPVNVGGVSDHAALDKIQTGHRAAISVTLNGEFADVDGSEAHGFIVSAPRGVAVVSGAGYAVSSLTAAELAALNSVDPAFAASGTVYRIVLPNSATAVVSLPVNLEVTTTVYNGGNLLVAGAASELLANGTRDYAITVAPSVALPPAVTPDFGNEDPVPAAGSATVDSLRETNVSGTLNMNVDPDGDAVTVNGVSFGDVAGAPGTVDGKPCHSVDGQYGTLHVFADGSYRYDLNVPGHPVNAQEVFGYQLADTYGGMGQGAITINLVTPNTAPTATPVAARLDSVRQSVVEGALTLGDKDGDAVAVASVNGSATLVNLGTADDPLWGFAAAGQYGTIQVFEQNGQWKYRYQLDADHRGEVRDEAFTFTVRDAHGMENASSIKVDLYNVNTSPVAGRGAATLDTLRDADDMVSGQVAVSDKDKDTVRLNAAAGPDGAAGAWGQDADGTPALVVQGAHGVLYLHQSGGAAIQYRYVLTDQAAAGLNAVETFTYHVDDGYLGTASNTISINLTNTNNAPTITGTLNREIDTLRTTTGQTSSSLTFSDPDYNADAGRHDQVTLSGVRFADTAGAADDQGGFTVSGAHGVFHISANGAYTYTLNPASAGEVGREAFTVTVTDEFGATRQQTVSIDLVLHNQNPQASNGVLKLDTWRDGGTASGSVTLSDADGDTVRVDSLAGTRPGVWGVDDLGVPSFAARGEHGTLYLHEDGSYRYILDAAGQSGQDVFTYTVRDGFRGSATASITINLDDANTAPVLSGDLSASIGGSIDRYEGGLVREEGQLAWHDVDGDAITSVSIGGVTLPAAGSVSIAGQYGALHLTMQAGGASYVYTLQEGLDSQGIRAVDSFAIVVTDEFGGTSSQALDVNLSPLSHSPECDDVNINWPTTASGDPLSFATGALSFRDADLDYDPAESLTLAVNTTVISGGKVSVQGEHGTLTIEANGSFSYTVADNLGQDLLEDFTYTVTDNAGNSVSAHLYIRLSDNAPVFPNTGTTEAGIVPAGAEITAALPTALFDDFSFLASSDPTAAPDAHAPQENADPAPAEPVAIDLVNVPLPHDVDAAQSIA